MTLLQLQRDFHGWLTSEQPGSLAAVQGAEAGLAVYLGNYRGALMACLAESFPVTRAWLGEAAFAAAAATHVDRIAPSDWTLDAYALGFPATLAALYPADAEVADLARIERALGQAFVGSDAAPLDPAGLAAVDWDRAEIVFVPTFTLLPMTSNAGAIWSAIAGDQAPPAAAALSEPALVAVWREGYIAAFRTLEPDEADAVSCVQDGMRFGALCARLVERLGEERGPGLAGELLGRWFGDGFIARID